MVSGFPSNGQWVPQQRVSWSDLFSSFAAILLQSNNSRGVIWILTDNNTTSAGFWLKKSQRWWNSSWDKSNGFSKLGGICHGVFSQQRCCKERKWYTEYGGVYWSLVDLCRKQAAILKDLINDVPLEFDFLFSESQAEVISGKQEGERWKVWSLHPEKLGYV